MKKILFTLAIAMILASGTAFGQDNSVNYSGSMRWGDFEYKWTKADFVNTPSWNPENGEPPVSATRAQAIAKASLSRWVDRPELMKPWSFELRNAGDDKWYWRVHFMCRGAECRNAKTRTFASIIKLDESILEPKRLVAVD